LFLDFFNPAGLSIDRIRQLYISREGWLAPFPWCEEFHFHLDQIFATLKVVRREKTGGTLTANIVNMSEIFKPVEKCTQPRTVLIEGKPGMGKTTYCRKLAYDWATGKLWTSEKPRFLTVLMLRCCDMKSNLLEAIDDQLLPREVEEHTKKTFFTFLRQNQSDVLLVLDGLDEVPTDKLSEFKEIIQGRRDLPRCYVVATARQEAGIEVRIHADTLLQIEGFDDEDAKKFILQYFAKLSEKYAEKLWSEVTRDANLKDMLTNPLHTALLCLDFDENEGSFPESKSQLYLDVAQCILRRYKKKKGLSETKEDVIEEFAVQLKHLGSLALNGLLEDKLNFEERELKDHGDGLPEFGFLSAQTGSKLRPSRRYSFQHKSFQEWFAAYFLSCQLMEKEISPESLVADKRYAHELKEVLPYTCGLLAAGCKAARCKEVAVTLTKRMMKEVNKGGRDGWLSVLLECTRECKQKDSSFQADLVSKLGSFLELETLKLHDGNLSAANVAVLADVLESNTTVTELNLCHNDIGDPGVASLACKLQSITTLKVLKLSSNGIGDAGAADLARALKFNTRLTDLYFSSNCIGEAGAKCVADALKSNKTLTDLDLSFNEIGDAGAAALADGLKSNTTLIVLYLSANGISDVARGLADGLKSNTTLSKLNLSRNAIGDAGAADLTDLLKSTTTQSALKLAQYGVAGPTDQRKSTLKTELNLSRNGIGGACTAGLAGALKSNTTPTVLDLSENSIGVADIADVADGLKFNTTLSELNLSCNKINDKGAANLAYGLKFNTALTVLNLLGNKIGGAGAKNLADGLKSNTKLRVLNLSGNAIGDDGAAHLAGALESNKTLTVLYLCDNGIGNAGAKRLGDGLKSNTTLTKLWLSGNYIGSDGLSALSGMLKSNRNLTVDLSL